MNAPDFIIIGAMKSATSTLHSQLAQQPGIFMSTPKEPNFFSDDSQYDKGPAWYIDLFSTANENDICGESSTHYTKLPDYPNTVERLKKWKKEYKFIYVMRHPIDRLISHYIHLWSEGEISCDINSAIKRYPELINYSCYARQLQPYFKEFGQASVLPVFIESLRTHPQRELERIASFIGYKGTMTWCSESDAENISSSRVRKFPGYSILVGSKFPTLIRRVLVPKIIRALIKDRLRMKTRPTLDRRTQELLESIFDKDLGEFSNWFGVKLNCQNFSEPRIQKMISSNLDRGK